MNRRQFLIGSGVAVSVVAGLTVRKAMQSPADIPAIVMELEQWRGRNLKTVSGWSPFKVFSHLAQSIELSMTGYPEMKSAVFQHTAGSAAFLVFSVAGAMRHSLVEPIPGAPVIADDGADESDVEAALVRLQTALNNFANWQGELMPHFAYGSLDKQDYAHAHLMHIRDHLRLLRVA